jgi:hypothetical protein
MKRYRRYKGYNVEYGHNGLTISTVTDNGNYLHQLYQGYSFKECIELFAEYVQQFENQFIYEEA